MFCRCRSRWVGLVPAFALGTAVERGGHDHGGIRGMRSHGFCHTGLVVGPVGNETGKGLLNLVQQGADLRAVVHVVVGQDRRHDPPDGGVEPDVQLLPGASALGAMLFDQPLAGTA